MRHIFVSGVGGFDGEWKCLGSGCVGNRRAVYKKLGHADFGFSSSIRGGAAFHFRKAGGAGMGQADTDLIRRWQAGEAAAFEAVARRWQAPLARFLSRLAPADQVPDLVQEVLLRLHRAGPTYRENGHFSTWLFQIALNVARDAGRRQAHAAQALPAEEPAATGASAEQRCEARELGELVARAVAELPAPLREVLALRHDRDMNFEEMSRLVGIPASTLKSRFSAALRQLRARLAEWGVSPEEEP